MNTSAPTPQRILVVDDDPEIGALLSRYLSGVGFEVAVAGDGAQLRGQLQKGDIDLMLLDLGLPDEDGLSLLRQFRDSWKGPVIVISGRGDSVEKVIGLELGADDYVAKPFDLRELLARIRSVLRRAVPAPPAPEPPREVRRLRFDQFELDLAGHRLTRGEVEVPLTTGEFRLLRALLNRAHHVLSRDE
jgi:two-component system OmpR family response regulator